MGHRSFPSERKSFCVLGLATRAVSPAAFFKCLFSDASFLHTMETTLVYGVHCNPHSCISLLLHATHSSNVFHSSSKGEWMPGSTENMTSWQERQRDGGVWLKRTERASYLSLGCFLLFKDSSTMMSMLGYSDCPWGAVK